jgi:hypothetical protein
MKNNLWDKKLLNLMTCMTSVGSLLLTRAHLGFILKKISVVSFNNLTI